ncbi:AMP-binding protein, partial [Flavobacterium collinsii]
LHYKELLLSIVRDIRQPISDLGMLTKEEEYQLLHLFNDTRVAYPLDQTVVDLFEEQVKKTPSAIAVVYKGTELTYKELDEKSNQLGHYLKEQGVERDTLVGICLDRSVDMLIGILGILKSGGAYVPIKPDYPASRICYIAQDTGCSLMLTDRVNSGALGDMLSDIMMIVLDGTSAVYSNCSSESLGLTY